MPPPLLLVVVGGGGGGNIASPLSVCSICIMYVRPVPYIGKMVSL